MTSIGQSHGWGSVSSDSAPLFTWPKRGCQSVKRDGPGCMDISGNLQRLYQGWYSVLDIYRHLLSCSITWCEFNGEWGGIMVSAVESCSIGPWFRSRSWNWLSWIKFSWLLAWKWPPLWSSGQSSWLQIQRSRVRFPALPDFLRSSGSGTGFTQPREDNWGATWMKK
jgi:hypothetical protein